MTTPIDILLVEDNADDEQLAVRELRKLGPGTTVEVARDGREALDRLFDSAHSLPDLVLLDLKLPMIGGIEVLAALRDNPRTANLSVVVLASVDEPETVRNSYRKYAGLSIHKPVKSSDVAEIVAGLGLVGHDAATLY